MLPQIDPAAEWARCRPWIEAAVARETEWWTIEDVEAAIAAGEAVFWPGENAAVVTQFWPFPRMKALFCWFAGGDLQELSERMEPRITAWARTQGCTLAIGIGRAGWPRTLKTIGYRDLGRIVGRAL